VSVSVNADTIVEYQVSKDCENCQSYQAVYRFTFSSNIVYLNVRQSNGVSLYSKRYSIISSTLKNGVTNLLTYEQYLDLDGKYKNSDSVYLITFSIEETKVYRRWNKNKKIVGIYYKPFR
jgi:hypothetical protein